MPRGFHNKQKVRRKKAHSNRGKAKAAKAIARRRRKR